MLSCFYRNSPSHGSQRRSGFDGVSPRKTQNASEKVPHKYVLEADSPRQPMDFSSPQSLPKETPYSFISDMSESPSFQSNDMLHENQEVSVILDNTRSPSSSKSPVSTTFF